MQQLDPIVQFTVHPPERRRLRSGTPAQAGQCCCCCCCCCLHTLASLIGAGIAPAIGRRRDIVRTQEEEDYGDGRYYDSWTPGSRTYDREDRRRWSAVGWFWLNSLIVTVAACLLGIAYALAGNGGNADGWIILVGLVLLAIFFPAIQLVAAFVTFLVLACSSRPDKGRQFAQIGKITLGVVAGTILGLVVMFGVGLVLTQL